MLREVLQGKIHKATVTQANIDYIGSITIDPLLLEKSGIWIGQKVLVVDNTNGARLETYTIEGTPGSGEICINGAAAHMIRTGDEVIIIGFVMAEEPVEPQCILVDENNKFVRYL